MFNTLEKLICILSMKPVLSMTPNNVKDSRYVYLLPLRFDQNAVLKLVNLATRKRNL